MIKAVANKKSIDFVLPTTMTLYYNNKSRDITAEVLSELDTQMPEVKSDLKP
ncbi:OmpH family outer membrane protein [Alphaproteobacteria bacterium]|nr:OmpH family outer membrane protein [Alphaproteobacteria bacterium]